MAVLLHRSQQRRFFRIEMVCVLCPYAGKNLYPSGEGCRHGVHECFAVRGCVYSGRVKASRQGFDCSEVGFPFRLIFATAFWALGGEVEAPPVGMSERGEKEEWGEEGERKILHDFLFVGRFRCGMVNERGVVLGWVEDEVSLIVNEEEMNLQMEKENFMPR